MKKLILFTSLALIMSLMSGVSPAQADETCDTVSEQDAQNYFASTGIEFESGGILPIRALNDFNNNFQVNCDFYQFVDKLGLPQEFKTFIDVNGCPTQLTIGQFFDDINSNVELIYQLWQQADTSYAELEQAYQRLAVGDTSPENIEGGYNSAAVLIGIDESFDPNSIANWASTITEVVNSCPPNLYPGELAQSAGELRAAFDEVLNLWIQLTNYADSNAVDKWGAAVETEVERQKAEAEAGASGAGDVPEGEEGTSEDG